MTLREGKARWYDLILFGIIVFAVLCIEIPRMWWNKEIGK